MVQTKPILLSFSLLTLLLLYLSIPIHSWNVRIVVTSLIDRSVSISIIDVPHWLNLRNVELFGLLVLVDLRQDCLHWIEILDLVQEQALVILELLGYRLPRSDVLLVMRVYKLLRIEWHFLVSVIEIVLVFFELGCIARVSICDSVFESGSVHGAQRLAWRAGCCTWIGDLCCCHLVILLVGITSLNSCL